MVESALRLARFEFDPMMYLGKDFWGDFGIRPDAIVYRQA
jgi:hypothetical protein